jgi:hypothetical protein
MLCLSFCFYWICHCAITVAARFGKRKSALVDVPGNGVVHGLSGRRRLGLRRRGRRLLARSSFPPGPTRRRRDLARTRRTVGGAELHTRSQGSQQSGTARWLGRFHGDLAGPGTRGQGGFAVPELGHPRPEGCLDSGGIRTPQSALGC